MEIIISLFLAVSLVFYVVFAGADFGMGMLEILCPKSLRKRVAKVSYRAIGPVWEANHVWLILAVVITFVGFPRVYSTLSVSLHIPLSLLLLGIVLRGSAFTFRHYDAVVDGSQKWYAILFQLSSFWSSFFLGICAAAVMNGEMGTNTGSFWEIYISPWWNLFGVSVGIFLCFIHLLLASIFLLGEELPDDLLRLFKRRARELLLGVVITGSLVFLSAQLSDVHLVNNFLGNSIGLTIIVLAILNSLLLLWAIWRRKPWTARVLVGLLVSIILVGWFVLQFPILIHLKNGENLTIFNAHAPRATLRGLLWALSIGVAAIFPALGYLFYVFKIKDEG